MVGRQTRQSQPPERQGWTVPENYSNPLLFTVCQGRSINIHLLCDRPPQKQGSVVKEGNKNVAYISMQPLSNLSNPMCVTQIL